MSSLWNFFLKTHAISSQHGWGSLFCGGQHLAVVILPPAMASGSNQRPRGHLETATSLSLFYMHQIRPPFNWRFLNWSKARVGGEWLFSALRSRCAWRPLPPATTPASFPLLWVSALKIDVYFLANFLNFARCMLPIGVRKNCNRLTLRKSSKVDHWVAEFAQSKYSLDFFLCTRVHSVFCLNPGT